CARSIYYDYDGYAMDFW
nr:immunoglobulin heavy chain junction region [Mus musculus]MBK4195787.1 immunoglobulin heavy chain junction region [Mus musculus]MBK4195788.1 immunoglobulin heavy chain junction region [Mus musculus]